MVVVVVDCEFVVVDCGVVVWADATPSANASTVKGSNKRFILFSTPDRKCVSAFQTSMESSVVLLSY